MHNDPRHSCPVCGYIGLCEPAYDAMGCSSFDICPCCKTQFGYDDATRSHAALRRQWLEAGGQWWLQDGPPPGWNPVDQLKQPGLPIDADLVPASTRP